MSDASARLGLPHILPSQAQKHVTHNEAIEILDALVHLTLEGRDAVAPPVAPQPGETWSLGASPSAEWTGQAGMIARWDTSGWRFIVPAAGMRAWDASSSEFLVYSGSGWTAVFGDLQNLDGLGIGTTSDAANRLAVSADASLLTHAGGAHQLKVNKAGTSDTASLLFQSNWTGHAEMGLAGEDNFSVKVSADGAAWTTAFSIDAATGTLAGAAVQQDATDLTADKIAIVGATYGPGSILGSVSQSGGVPTGAVIERGQNTDGEFVRFADGTQICWNDDFTLTASNQVMAQDFWTFPAVFSAAPAISFTLSAINANWSGLDRSQVSIWGPIVPPTTTNVKLAIYPTAGVGNFTATISGTSAVAVGRWF